MTPAINEDLKHARYSPSAMARIIADPLSVFLSYNIPGKRSKYADKGDNAHKLGEHFLKQAVAWKPINELSIIGRPTSCEIDDAMIGHCRDYATYGMAQVYPRKHLPHLFFIEKKLTLSIVPEMFGTSDFVFLYQTPEDGYWHLVIVDLKYGEGIKVLSEENWQLIAYALFALAEFESHTNVLQQAHDKTKHPRAEASIIDVEMHIFQPRADSIVPPVKFHRNEIIEEPWAKIQEAVSISEMFFERAIQAYGLDKLPTLTTAEKSAIISPEEFAKYMKAGKHCQFCKFKPQCRAAADRQGAGKVLELLATVAPRVEALRPQLPQEFTPTGRVKKPPTTEALLSRPELVYATGALTDEDKAFFSLNGNALINLIKSVKNGFKEELKNGVTNPYAYLGKASPVREWIPDEDAIKKTLAEKFGINDFVRMVPKKLTITEVEERIGKDKLEALGLTHSVRETAKLLPVGNGAEAAPPRGFHTSLIVRQLLNMPMDEEEQDDEEAGVVNAE